MNLKISKTCIYCKNENSINLLEDGSFRKCLSCRKNFWAVIKSQQHPITSQNVSFKIPLFGTMRPNYLPDPPPNKSYFSKTT
jgi:hypothetical protein